MRRVIFMTASSGSRRREHLARRCSSRPGAAVSIFGSASSATTATGQWGRSCARTLRRCLRSARRRYNTLTSLFSRRCSLRELWHGIRWSEARARAPGPSRSAARLDPPSHVSSARRQPAEMALGGIDLGRMRTRGREVGARAHLRIRGGNAEMRRSRVRGARAGSQPAGSPPASTRPRLVMGT
jgi:hypothetical protein